MSRVKLGCQCKGEWHGSSFGSQETASLATGLVASESMMYENAPSQGPPRSSPSAGESDSRLHVICFNSDKSPRGSSFHPKCLGGCHPTPLLSSSSLPPVPSHHSTSIDKCRESLRAQSLILSRGTIIALETAQLLSRCCLSNKANRDSSTCRDELPPMLRFSPKKRETERVCGIPGMWTDALARPDGFLGVAGRR